MSIAGQPCSAGFLHAAGYPAGVVDNPPPRQIPAVKITRPDDENTKPVEKKPTAIDSLRAVSSLKVRRLSVKQLGENEPPSSENGATQAKKSAGAPVAKLKENDAPNVNQGWTRPVRTNSSPAVPTRAAMESATNRATVDYTNMINRSVSMSTVASENTRGSLTSLKSNPQASESQTTLFSTDTPEPKQLKEPKGKEKVVYNSPESLNDFPTASAKSPLPETQRSTPGTKDTSVQVGEAELSAHGYGKMVLGCSQCLFDPKLRVIPCNCFICIDCGGRFWTTISSGNEVICGCGDVSDSLNSNITIGLMVLACCEHGQYRERKSSCSGSGPRPIYTCRYLVFANLVRGLSNLVYRSGSVLESDTSQPHPLCSHEDGKGGGYFYASPADSRD